jgi:uncharacterized SAM-binding protein YcdF (DUF218 family)
MYFVLSKIIGFIAVPSNIMLLIAIAGAILMRGRFASAGRGLTIGAIALLVITGFSPFGNALILPLEQRFPPWSFGQGAPDGIIVLGGAINPEISAARGEPSLNETAERLTALAALARQFPQARIAFSGGDASLLGGGPSEAEFVLPMLESFGIPANRVELEAASRNTHENAVLTAELIKPKPGERWLVVTSAYHMPRAIGSFRSIGFAVEPYPVDWRTRGLRDLGSPFETAAGGLARTDVAVREWMGLVVYWLTGRSSQLFPGP